MQAFKSYDEAGERRRIQTLKYLVLANMLMESQVDPFDAQEAKPYKTDSEVQAMTNLVDAYQRNNIKDFEKILRTNKYDGPLHFSSLVLLGPCHDVISLSNPSRHSCCMQQQHANA